LKQMARLILKSNENTNTGIFLLNYMPVFIGYFECYTVCI